MEKRYQVFVSSTYQDLIEERIEVIQALLELDCIPVGMEYFPAADETQWDFIKKLIDDSDYYIVIIAGKYGSEDENGTSFTQKEYEYAIEKGIPIIGFIHSDIGELQSSRTENDSIKAEKLELFKEIVKRKLCKFWKNHLELGAVVSRSLSQAKKNYPRIGWVRADSISNTSEKEIVDLYKTIQQLESKVKDLSSNNEFKKLNVENLAEDDEEVEINIDIKSGSWNSPTFERKTLNSSWKEINYHFLPKFINPIRKTSFKSTLNSIATEIYLNNNKDIF